MVAFYVNTQKFAGFEVRGPQVPGGLAVFGVKQGVTIPDGGRFALSSTLPNDVGVQIVLNWGITSLACV
ncbi:hypothetical protein [Nonomuraea sp. NPDC049784]|uniref:hypothetical protein n=1 Tax=Nonomuraea sp. NPDC049784 TaxID=3154361 RepID=UPI0034099CDF